ncbi:MAG: tetratricopeptide repeat protein [Planctomycetota bacterium]
MDDSRQEPPSPEPLPQPAGDASQSVLATVSRLTGSVAPRVSLRDVPSDHAGSPVVKPTPAARDLVPQGRANYQVQGEIARGGMGVILKGHDPDLGRDVAMKVLHEGMDKKPEALHRFVEEAQVGGQLQHPGIVPVYDLGMMEDGRPYFTMKLVKGRTMASYLSERSNPLAGRAAMLDVFESVCQTIAYAHSRGVIHRDLKPANVLVGAFGEVQVVDWGLAKVLPRGGTADERRSRRVRESRGPVEAVETVRSDGSGSGSSLAGSVMGTPAYMAPEQARGEVDLLDERTDVFALGAILTEILTGHAPYRGAVVNAVRQAASAELGETLVRLERSDAAPELVGLAKECLSEAPSERPRSAQVLAERVRKHLQSVQERARSAEIEAAKARVKADEERRARRLMLVASAVVLLALIGGGFAWAARITERAERERQTTAEVNTALAEATLHRRSGSWTEARAACERAQAILAAGAPTEELEARTDAIAAEVVSGYLAHEREQAFEAENAELVRRLARLRDGQRTRLEASDGPFRLTVKNARAAAYRGFFDSLGVDPDGTVGDAEEHLIARGISAELAAGLDGWASTRIAIDNEPTPRWRWLVELAMRIDEDPDRRALRRALLREDRDELARMASADENLGAETATALASALDYLGLDGLQRGVLERLVERHPGEFTSNFELGMDLLDDDGMSAESVRYLTVAAALQPRNVVAANNLAHAFWRADRVEEAVEWYRRAVELDPGHGFLHNNLARVLKGSGDLEGALASYREAARRAPTNSRMQSDFGMQLFELGELREASEAFRAAIDGGDPVVSDLVGLGACQQELGDPEAAEAAYRDALEMDPESPAAHNNLGMLFEDQGRLEEARGYYVRATELRPGLFEAWLSLGRVRHILEDFPGAIDAYRTALELMPSYATGHANLGTALEAEGRLDEAVASLGRALELAPDFPYALTGLARVLAQSPEEAVYDPVEAARFASRSVELAPDDAGAWLVLGEALFRAGDPDESITALERSTELAGEATARAALLQALVLDELDELSEAEEWAERALALAADATAGREIESLAPLVDEVRQTFDL